MQRRTFFSALAAPALAAAAPAAKARFYSVDYFLLKQGSQRARLDEYLSKGALPALARAGAGPVLVMEAVMAPHMPQVAMIAGWPSAEAALTPPVDAELTKRVEAWEVGDEPAVESQTRVVLEATPYSPELAVPAQVPKTTRIFELRVYHSPTLRQLRALHHRFSSAEIGIFHRSGVHPVLYSSTVAGPAMPNLTYLIPFDNLDAREKAWAKFGADPEWIKVRKESIDQSGQISSVMQISLYKAVPYSPVQ